MKEINRG